MKKIVMLVLVSLLCMTTMMTAFAQEEGGITPEFDWYGDGTASTFYISSINELAGLAKLTQGAVSTTTDTFAGTSAATTFSGKTVILTTSLAFGENEYWYNSSDGTDFRIMDFAGTFNGGFDGGEYTITGLKFKNTATGNTHKFGLFHTVVSGGAVNNVKLNTVTADLAHNNYFGSLVSDMNGSATNCHVDGVTVANSGQMNGTGGLFRNVSGCTITNCSAKNVTFNGSSSFYQVGGLSGACSGSTLENCTTEIIKFNGTNLQMVGGLIGILSSSTLENCKAETVTFNGTSSAHGEGGFGGLVGTMYSDTATITSCSVSDVTATITGNTNKCGGFIGIIKGSTTLSGCNATNVTLTLGGASGDQIKVTGGFVGQIYGGTNTITNCHVIGLNAKVTGTYETAFAGFCTMQNSTTTFDNCSVSGKIDATGVTDADETGGFLGDLGYGGNSVTTLKDCTADVDITANGPVGGFIASSWGYSTGSIAGSITATNCHAYGDVTSLSGVAGGFVGVGNRGSYTGCTASGNVTSNVDAAGGFWGEITPYTPQKGDKAISISDCSASGKVNAGTYAGGIVGFIEADDTGVGHIIIGTECTSATDLTGTVTNPEANLARDYCLNGTAPDTDGSGTHDNFTHSVCYITIGACEVGYPSIQAAANTGATAIWLTQNADESFELTTANGGSNGSFTLNLGEYTLSGSIRFASNTFTATGKDEHEVLTMILWRVL